jgi:hypothetical protein
VVGVLWLLSVVAIAVLSCCSGVGHQVTKTVRWNRPDDRLIGEIEEQIGQQQRDVAHRQTQRMREVRAVCERVCAV